MEGGLLIYSLTEFDSRVTVDVDFLLKQISNTPEQLRKVVTEIILVETGNDFIVFEIMDVVPIALTKKYAGVGDIIVPKQEKRCIPTQLEDFTSPIINTYSIETTVAEKIDAILSLMEFSSRMKDYYDI